MQVGRIAFREAAANLSIGLVWYNSSDGADGAIASGAYIFRWAGTMSGTALKKVSDTSTVSRAVSRPYMLAETSPRVSRM